MKIDFDIPFGKIIAATVLTVFSGIVLYQFNALWVMGFIGFLIGCFAVTKKLRELN